MSDDIKLETPATWQPRKYPATTWAFKYAAETQPASLIVVPALGDTVVENADGDLTFTIKRERLEVTFYKQWRISLYKTEGEYMHPEDRDRYIKEQVRIRTQAQEAEKVAKLREAIHGVRG